MKMLQYEVLQWYVVKLKGHMRSAYRGRRWDHERLSACPGHTAWTTAFGIPEPATGWFMRQPHGRRVVWFSLPRVQHWHAFAHRTMCKPRSSARSKTTLLKHSVTFRAVWNKRLTLMVASLEGVAPLWRQMYVENRWDCGSEVGKRERKMNLFFF